MTRWQLLAPLIATGDCFVFGFDGGDHHGRADLVRINADGSCHLRFDDGASFDMPARRTSKENPGR